MVRFLCFNAHIPSHKSKKTVTTSLEEMYKSLHDCSLTKSRKDLVASTLIINDNTSSTSIDRGWKSGEMLKKSNQENGAVDHQKVSLKKCQSLGSGLYREDNFFCNSDDDETDPILSCDEARDTVPDHSKNEDLNSFNQYPDNLLSESFQVSSGVMNNESIFSVGDPQNLEKGDDNITTPIHDDCVFDSGICSPRSIPGIVRSSSFPNISPNTPTIKGSSPFKYLRPRSRSSEDLHLLELRQKENSGHEVNREVMRGKEKDDGLWEPDNFNGENLGDETYDKFYGENVGDEAYDSYNYAGSSKDWIMPNQDEIKMKKPHQGESSSDQQWNELPNKDFKIKRIEDWVSNLQHCNSLEETDEPSIANDQGNKSSNGLNNLTNAKMDAKVTPGMEAAKRYISSLSAAATTTAQLSNHGLVVVPFLSAFASLRVLNLSGNAIVRILAGALPRGLHMLNLSKNSISTIEGLRDLTRLRILDLSYNRILRIGHGLASCSSLKELYLAGNKISEVEGLHRLLKLNVLDLRFNKISTTKGLGQLAANYNSLQAISLEGNPAQKNVGDEQVKKYLQGLLTQLVYYNRKPIKTSTLKDATDRSVRLGVSGTHGLKSDPKVARRGNHGARRGPAVVSPKVTRGRRRQLPPSGTKVATANHPNPYFEFGSKILGLRQDLSMRRSRSVGNLGTL